ncbi:uncharacterized protein [Henckelia pumila]|uniref:uncharacterized protein n=1 Tax=Henckelia pumila TaxID=405737 RepID=UPI003C6DE32E
MAMIRNNMNADISYYKAWRGKELADNILKGDPTKSFTLLPCYLHMVEKMNRGSITDICIDEKNRFKYMFLAFGACVRGYRSMRKVVSIDGTWCKKKGAVELFLQIAKIYKQNEFDIAYSDFRKRYPEAAQFLDERDTLDRWTRAYCPNTRYNIMTTNGVESINARLLEERKLPIISLLDSLQRLTSSWFVRYRNASVAANTNLTPTIEGILRSRFTDAQGMQVFELGRLEFDVRSGRHSAIVDLESKRCTCRVFDIDRVPCSHAIAASWLAKIDLYQLCSEYYSTMTWCMAYSETVYPVPEESEWPRNINFPVVLPPCLEKRVGRKKQKRIPSIGEFSKR